MRPTVRAALFLSLLVPAAAVAASAADIERALPFVSDDYAKALAEARAQKLPLFIEAWAPW